jgi:serine/threonine protein kinase
MAEILNYRNALPLDTMLLEYRLESILGAGGFGMTYLAYDTLLQKKVAIKEYLPVELAVRALDGSIVPINTGTEYNYKWGLDRFLQEARLLAKFSHPNIVQVKRYFEANGTAYMVMNYESGMSLSQLLKRIPRPDEPMLIKILMPLLNGLEAVQQAGFLHRDIKPSNIFIRDTGVPVLLDFGAARLASIAATRTMTSILTPGYAPLEQYSKDGNQGPWTDIYSLAAVVYRAVSGENPPDAVGRMKADPVKQTLSALHDRYSAGFLHGINRGMEIDEKKRPQSVAAWRTLFTGTAAPSSAALLADADAGHTQNAMENAPTQLIEKTVALETTMIKMQGPSVSQLSWFAAGVLVLFLAVEGGRMFNRAADKAPSNPLPVTVAPAPVTNPSSVPAMPDFDTLDVNHDGYLTPDEVKGTVLEQNFQKLDVNGDGRISREEFNNAR